MAVWWWRLGWWLCLVVQVVVSPTGMEALLRIALGELDCGGSSVVSSAKQVV